MIGSMIKGWGAAASITFAAVAAVTVSGCGGTADAETKAPPTPSAASIGAATTGFKDAVTKFDVSNGCPKEAGACWDKMLAVMEPARELRKAMNTNQAGPAFWTQAYALIDKMERGIAVGEDRVSNRPDVLGSAHELSRWLDAHPAQ